MATVVTASVVTPNLGTSFAPTSPVTASAVDLSKKSTNTEYYTVKETKIYDKAQLSGHDVTVVHLAKGLYLERLSAKKYKINGEYYVHAKYSGVRGYVLASTVKAVKMNYSAFKKLDYARVGQTNRTINIRNAPGTLSTVRISKTLNAKSNVIVDGYRIVNNKKFYHVIYVAPTGKQTKGYVYSGYIKLVGPYTGKVKTSAKNKLVVAKKKVAKAKKKKVVEKNTTKIKTTIKTTNSNNTTTTNTNSNNTVTTINAENVYIQQVQNNVDTNKKHNSHPKHKGVSSGSIYSSPGYYKDPKNYVPAPVYVSSYVKDFVDGSAPSYIPPSR